MFIKNGKKMLSLPVFKKDCCSVLSPSLRQQIERSIQFLFDAFHHSKEVLQEDIHNCYFIICFMIIKGSSPIKTSVSAVNCAEMGKDVPNPLLVQSPRSLPPAWCWLYASRGDKQPNFPGSSVYMYTQTCSSHRKYPKMSFLPAPRHQFLPQWTGSRLTPTRQGTLLHKHSTAPSHNLLSLPYSSQNHPFQMARQRASSPSALRRNWFPLHSCTQQKGGKLSPKRRFGVDSSS